MSKAVVDKANIDFDKDSGNELASYDWQAELEKQAFAYGQPNVSGRIKASPEDFIVTEIMDVIPSGEGEHIWLDVTKTRNNTDRVARELAKYAGVANRDVGYSGLKDFQAVTRQWFSVWRPKGEPLDWSEFEVNGVQLNQIVNHSRKIRRSTHSLNRFEICIRDLHQDSATESALSRITEIELRLERIKVNGVPNYFGVQRFGRNANNMREALAMFAGKKRVKDRALRGILLSSARSWIFNSVLSSRVANGSWAKLFALEPANLHGSNSTFTSANSEEDQARINALDIHPTAPMWGEGRSPFEAACPDLAEFENNCLSEFDELRFGLELARLEHQRRATRTIAQNLSWTLDDSNLVLCFELLPGQYATSVLRELVRERL